MARAILTSKGRITIPKQIRAALRVKPGDRIEFLEMEKGRFLLVPLKRSVKELRGLLRGKVRKPASAEAAMNASITRRR